LFCHADSEGERAPKRCRTQLAAGEPSAKKSNNRIQERLVREVLAKIPQLNGTLPEKLWRIVGEYAVSWLDHEIANLIWSGNLEWWSENINCYIQTTLMFCDINNHEDAKESTRSVLRRHMESLEGFGSSDAKQRLEHWSPHWHLIFDYARDLPLTTLTVFNASGKNGDPRCTRTIQESVDFHDTFSVHCPAGVFAHGNAANLLEVAVRAVKTSRHDGLYELYSSAEVDMSEDLRELKVNLYFDHGSCTCAYVRRALRAGCHVHCIVYIGAAIAISIAIFAMQ
jgi:hypothetical protein